VSPFYRDLSGSVRFADFPKLDPFMNRWPPSHPVNNWRDDQSSIDGQLGCHRGKEVYELAVDNWPVILRLWSVLAMT